MLSSIKQKAPGQAQQKAYKAKKNKTQKGKVKKKGKRRKKTKPTKNNSNCRHNDLWGREIRGTRESWAGFVLEIERVARICTAPQGKMPASVADRQPRRIHVEYEAKCQFGEIYTYR